MSTQPNYGGPAFPTAPDVITKQDGGFIDLREYGLQGHPGMSLRAYIATKAMAAIIAAPGMEPDDASRIGVADLALEFADALEISYLKTAINQEA